MIDDKTEYVRMTCVYELCEQKDAELYIWSEEHGSRPYRMVRRVIGSLMLLEKTRQVSRVVEDSKAK